MRRRHFWWAGVLPKMTTTSVLAVLDRSVLERSDLERPDVERQMSEAPGSTRYDAVPLSTEQQTRFVSENQRRVFLLIYRIVGNVADAQDLTQEAVIKALQRQDQLKDLEKAAHWRSRIPRYTAIRVLRGS